MDHFDVECFVLEFRAGLALYRRLLDDHVYPPFTAPERTAMREARTVWDQWMAQPAGEQGPGDLADDANDFAISRYDELFAMQTILMNLFAAGLFHLFEQQMAAFLHHDRHPVGRQVRQSFAEWSQTTLRRPLEDFPQLALIIELELAANAAKHAEGPSEQELKRRRRDLFGHPMFREPAYEPIRPSHFLPTRMPLGGTDLYITKGDFEQYASALDDFWQWVLASFNDAGTPSAEGRSTPRTAEQ